ncbi:MAG: thioredoxin family protein [Gemmatimonadota bacterium]|nr:thioredoxin family protein [Gemmatimonadota bacterium]
MPIQWRRDADAALEDARTQNRPLLLDFSAAPM